MQSKIAILMLSVLLLTACGPAPVQDTTQPDVECIMASDCEGKPHVMCTGEWNCINAECAYECAVEEPVVPEPEPEVTEPEPEVVEPEPEVVEPEEVDNFEGLEPTLATIDYVTGEVETKFAVLGGNFKIVSAGEGFAAAFALKNNMRVSNTFRVKVTYEQAYTEGNQPIFRDETEMASWVDVEGEFTLDMGETRIVPVKIFVPDEDIPAGSYEFIIQAQYLDNQFKDHLGQFTVTAKVK